MTHEPPKPDDPQPERFNDGFEGGANRPEDADLAEHGAFEADDYVDDDDDASDLEDFDDDDDAEST